MSAEKILTETLGCNKDDLTLQWNNLSYAVKTHKNQPEKYILNNVSGSAKNKTFTAILGPSGAGKTTLLEAMSCRTKIQGIVSINGYFMTHTFMKAISAFVTQYYATFDALNVQEYLQFMCAMKMYKLLNLQERNLRVSDVIYEFGLEKCRGTQIANLSGGEKRKVYIAAELLSDPAIIFCDEPTTGLDSYNAQQIITILKEQASYGKIVIISIHQPASNLIQYFDNFILLSLGSIILSGDQNTITTFFDKMNIKCPPACNIAEFYIKEISVIPGFEEKCIEKINNIRTKFLENQSHRDNLNPWLKSINFKEILKCPYYIQFFWLFWRELVVLKRTIFQELLTVLCLSITGLIIALFYSSVKLTNDTQDVKGYMYYLVSELLFTGTYNVLDTFPREIPIFKSEKDLYSSSIYYLVKVSSKFYHLIIWPFCYLSILYYFAPFNMDVYLYLKVWFIISIALITAEAYGFMFSSIFENTKYIELIMVPVDVFFLLTSGLFVKIDTIPYVFTWTKYMSSFFYASDAVSILYWNQYYENHSPNMTTLRSNYTFEYQNYVHKSYFVDLYCLICLAIIMHLIGCCKLVQRKKKYYKA